MSNNLKMFVGLEPPPVILDESMDRHIEHAKEYLPALNIKVALIPGLDRQELYEALFQYRARMSDIDPFASHGIGLYQTKYTINWTMSAGNDQL